MYTLGWCIGSALWAGAWLIKSRPCEQRPNRNGSLVSGTPPSSLRRGGLSRTSQVGGRCEPRRRPNRSVKMAEPDLPCCYPAIREWQQTPVAPQYGRPSAGPMFLRASLRFPGVIPCSPAGDQPCLQGASQTCPGASISSTQAGTTSVAWPWRAASNQCVPCEGSRFSSSVAAPRSRAFRTKPAAG